MASAVAPTMRVVEPRPLVDRAASMAAPESVLEQVLHRAAHRLHLSRDLHGASTCGPSKRLVNVVGEQVKMEDLRMPGACGMGGVPKVSPAASSEEAIAAGAVAGSAVDLSTPDLKVRLGSGAASAAALSTAAAGRLQRRLAAGQVDIPRCTELMAVPAEGWQEMGMHVFQLPNLPLSCAPPA